MFSEKKLETHNVLGLSLHIHCVLCDLISLSYGPKTVYKEVKIFFRVRICQLRCTTFGFISLCYNSSRFSLIDQPTAVTRFTLPWILTRLCCCCFFLMKLDIQVHSAFNRGKYTSLSLCFYQSRLLTICHSERQLM